jgi:soluble lytic murein transglycosylase-like protein
MPEQRTFELGPTDRQAVGLRHNHGRRAHVRRSRGRRASDRQHVSRRRMRMRNVVLSMMAIALPPGAGSLVRSATPSVSVTVNAFDAVPLEPRHAFEDIILEAAAVHRLDPALIRSVIEAESQFDPAAVSSAGASGLMQLMPRVAASLGVSNLLDPRENVMAGARLLRELLDRFDGSVPLALASYNAGASTVARFGRVPPFPETQAYVRKVTRLLKKAREAGGA